MKGYLRRLGLAVLALVTAAVCCGCSARLGLTFDPQELYRLPMLPAKYTELSNQLSAILEQGAEFAAPVSGTNIQPVQMKDLDGDGREEAVAFFRNAEEEKPLKICIFTAEGDSYRQSAVIEGSGTAVYSIAYSDLDGDGQTELLVGWRVNTQLQALAVYALRPGGPEELMRSDYVKYAVADLNGDQMREIVVIRADEEGGGTADYYGWKTGSLAAQSSARISMTMAELSGQQGRVLQGTLEGGVPALYVTGVAESARSITDILTVKNEELTNLVLSAVTGVSTEIALFRGLYPADINNDGVTEVPWPVGLPTWDDDGSTSQCIDWRSYGPDGSISTVLSTYHDIEDGWYFQLPETWRDQILVSRITAPDEAAVTFYIRGSGGETARPFLRITALTGSSRENRAVRGGRFSLSRKSDTIYVAELLEANASWAHGLTEDQVRGAFSLITTEWTTGDN